MRSLLVIGAGLTGATIARLAHDANYNVTVIERRPWIGGNIRDEVHECGLRIGCYGPHYFRTSSEKVWRFVRRFSDWYGFSAIVTAWANGAYHAWPPRRTPNWDTMTWMLVRRVYTFEDAWLVKAPLAIYKTLVEPYTEKQWGCPANDLLPELARRVAIHSRGRALKSQRWQALPVNGYAALVKEMLSGCKVHVQMDHTLWKRLGAHHQDVTVFTGPVDEYYNFDLGHLGYRAQQRQHTWHPDADLINPEVQVNYADRSDPRIREIEWKHMLPRDKRTMGSLVTCELPYTPTDPDAYEYPIPTLANRLLYAKYAERAEADPNVVFAGRLGEYRYLDMDQAIGRAMKLWERKIQPMLEGE